MELAPGINDWRSVTAITPRQARLQPLRSQQVAVGHAERLEDVLAETAVERLPAHVLDDLAERAEPVVAVGEPGARLGRQAQAATVVFG